MSDDEKRHDIAIFRFGLIAPVLHGTHTGSAAEYFRRVTERELEVPYVGLVRYKPHTLKAWLSDYRANGFEGLVPKPRSDLGRHRVITPAIADAIRQLLTVHPRMSAATIREHLVDNSLITSPSPSESVVRRFIRDSVRVFAGCCQPLLGGGPSRRYLCGSFPGCLDPYPGSSHGARARFFPRDIGLPHVRTRSALCNVPHSDFCTGVDFGAAVIH